jgi:hypothetical protein
VATCPARLTPPRERRQPSGYLETTISVPKTFTDPGISPSRGRGLYGPGDHPRVWPGPGCRTPETAMPLRDLLSPDPVESAASLLLAFWQAGIDSLKRRKDLVSQDPGAYVYSTKLRVLEEEAAREGLNPDSMKKAWRAAKEYTEPQIRRLCTLVRKYQVRFGRSHLMRLMSVRDRAVRDKLALRAIEEGWSVTALERAIQAINGPRPHVGNRPTVPEGGRRLLADVVAKCIAWERWGEVAGPRLPDDVKALVDQATRAVVRVRAAASDRLPGPTTIGKAHRRRL